MMKLSITIVNYNQKYFPRICVESLKKSRFDGDMEIVVCDNHSSDESVEYLREANKKGDIHLVESKKNVGYGAGHNLAAKEAKGEYICILNTDITVGERTLDSLVKYLEDHDDVGIVAPKLIYHNGEVQKSCRRHFKLFDLFIKRTFLKKLRPFKKRYRRYVMEDFNHKEVQEVDLVTGAFMVMKKSLFDKVGGFDEKYFLFMEDFDLCKKVSKEGKNIVYFPVVKATHYHKRLSEGKLFGLLFNKISWYHFCSAVKYLWKWR